MPTNDLRTVRERASDALLRLGTEMSMDRRDMESSLKSVSSTAPGYHTAVHAVRMARWFDSGLLWMAWRLRPRVMTPDR